MTSIKTNCLPYNWISFTQSFKNFTSNSIFYLVIALFISSISIAQTPTSPADCRQGCTSNDVKIVTAYLSNINGVRLPQSFVCPSSGTATVYLTLELTTQTPRKGVVIYANIKTFTGGVIGSGAPLANKKECFGIELNQPTNRVTFQGSFGWTCGTPIVLTDVFIGWGTGNTDFCAGSSAFRCPATSSKCYSLPPGQYIPITTPTASPASDTKCSDAAGGTTAIFNLTNYESTVAGSQTNVTVTWYSDANLETAVPDKTQFTATAPSTPVYAKVSNNTDPTVYSQSTVTLYVNQTPIAPVLSVVDNCDGTSTITAKDGSNNNITASELTWSNGGSGNPISVTANTSVTAIRTVNSCPSPSINAVSTAPKTTPNAPVLSVVNNCDGTSTITAKAGNVNIAAGELTWSNGGSGNPISVTATTSVTATRTVNSCPSSASNSVTPAPKTTPAAPVLSVVNNCDGTSTITAKDGSNNNISASELTWSNGGSGNPISATATTSVTATRTINSCPSSASNSVSPAPKTTPAAPVLSVVNNCDGTSTITAKDGSNNNISASELTWSNGGSGNPISVTATTSVTATRTVGGSCPSIASNSVSPAPNTSPGAPNVDYLPPACDQTTFKVRVNSPTSGVTYSILDKDGNAISGVKVGATSTSSYTAPNANNFEFSNIPAGKGYQVTATNNSCPSSASSCGVTGGNNHSPDAGIQENPSTIQRINIPASKMGVKAFPNPFNDRIRFVVTAPESGRGSLEIFNTLGQKVKTVHQGLISEGTQTFDFTVPMAQRSTLMYVLKLNGRQVTGKLLNSSK